MVATKTKPPFCIEEVPVLVECLSSTRYMNPITTILYHYYTMAACNPLSPNIVRLQEGSYQRYGETLKKLNHEIYQWSMNSKLNVSDENLHRSLFSTSYVKRSQIARIIRQNSKGNISWGAIRDSV